MVSNFNSKYDDEFSFTFQFAGSQNPKTEKFNNNNLFNISRQFFIRTTHSLLL